MSDGERSAAIVAANVLSVEPGTVLLIDEPERRLHRSIIEPFLSGLFDRRKDCAFVISTHELALPAANPAARVLIVRSCKWEGGQANAWDVDLLESNSELPEDLRVAVLGGRRRVLFVEGTANSPDDPLYTALFPNVSVVPKGSCVDVQKAVKGLRESHALHHVEAFGLIDRDNRSPTRIHELEKMGVFALDVCSVESLYYSSDAIAAVASQQAESLGSRPSDLTGLAGSNALKVLEDNDLAERMAGRRCERQLHESILTRIPGWKDIVATNQTSPVSVCADSPYPDELRRFKKLVADEKLDDLVARYPLRDSRVFDEVAKALECKSRQNYQRMVTVRVQTDKKLARKLKERISGLSRVLDV